MTVESVLTMLGGIGMFLYGMKLMGNALERAAGAKMEKILERLTSSKPKGIILGAGVTAVIQSSAATIIMVVGFLNAGILKLAQGVPVIMGANIGTTVTAQILRMGDIDGG
ncbi:MAG: Na/Pi symporter, partial [Firmicutes bacterium]|nr:Na/Pi symporter [Bacillota bacterium]MDY2920888.1 Na/Pi symporter [Lentihominibacter sp.]